MRMLERVGMSRAEACALRERSERACASLAGQEVCARAVCQSSQGQRRGLPSARWALEHLAIAAEHGGPELARKLDSRRGRGPRKWARSSAQWPLPGHPCTRVARGREGMLDQRRRALVRSAAKHMPRTALGARIVRAEGSHCRHLHVRRRVATRALWPRWSRACLQASPHLVDWRSSRLALLRRGARIQSGW